MNYNNYECSANDRIDVIVNNHYGDLKNLNNVLEVNPELYDKSMNLKSGTIIKLPIYTQNKKDEDLTVSDEREPLW